MSVLLIVLASVGGIAVKPGFAQATDNMSLEVALHPELQEMADGKVIDNFYELLPVLRELEAINLKFIRQSGWYHTVREIYTADIGDHEGKPTEGMFANNIIEDYWVEVVDDSGALGLGSYTVISNLAGERLQVVAGDSLGKGGNLTLLQRGLENAVGSRESEGERAWLASLPTNINSQLTTYINMQSTFAPNFIAYKAWVEELPEGMALKMTKQSSYPQPLKFDEYPEAMLGTHDELHILLATGNIVFDEAYMVYESGREELWSSERLLVAEAGVAMPEDLKAQYLLDANLAESLKAKQGAANMSPMASFVQRYNYTGTATAQASSSNAVPDERQMICYGTSQIVPAVTINVIGGTWMGCSQKCRAANGAEITQNTRTVGGWATTGSVFYKQTNNSWSRCPSGSLNIQVTETTHDFNHTGSVQWRPFTDYYSYIN